MNIVERKSEKMECREFLMHVMDIHYHFYVCGEKWHMNSRLYIPSDNISVLHTLPHKNGLQLMDVPQNDPESSISYLVTGYLTFAAAQTARHQLAQTSWGDVKEALVELAWGDWGKPGKIQWG
jgi:hypothetical protein